MKRAIVFMSAALVLCTTSAFAQKSEPSNRPEHTNVKLTFFLIQADGFQNDDPEIRPIVAELRKVFKFQGYRLASKAILQAAPEYGGGQAIVHTVMNEPDGESFMLEAWVGAQKDASTAFIAVSLFADPFPRLQSGSARPAGLIDASVSLRDGKTVVLGSAFGGKSRGLILVVTPTIEK